MRLVLPLLLLASGARAECPTAADLAGGIRLRWSDGDMTTVRATEDPAVVEVRFDSSPAGHVTIQRAWGLYGFAITDDTIDGRAATTDYGAPPERLPRPTPNVEVRFAQVETLDHFHSWYRESYRMGPLGQVTLGTCSYRAFEVIRSETSLLRLEDDPGLAPRITTGWAYLADLGFAVESWFGPPEERRLAADVIAIEAVPP